MTQSKSIKWVAFSADITRHLCELNIHLQEEKNKVVMSTYDKNVSNTTLEIQIEGEFGAFEISKFLHMSESHPMFNNYAQNTGML
jgi:hypothetical protein